MSKEGHRAIPSHPLLHRWLGAAALLAAGYGVFVDVASAHEVKVLPMKGSERSQLLPIIVPGTHLSLSPSAVDFGTFDLFFSSTRELAITNDTDETLTLGFELPKETLTVAPSSLSLAPGETATVTLDWFPELGGTLDEPMTILVSHAGVAAPARREVPLSGTVISVLDISPRSLDFGVIDRAATKTETLEVINLEPVETTVSILPSSSFLFVDPPGDQQLGAAGSATDRKTYAITFNPVGLELDVVGNLILIGEPAGDSQTPHLVRVVGKSSDLGTSGIFREHDEVDFSVVRPGSYTAVVPLWNRSAVDTVEVSFALSGGSHASLAPSDLVIGPGGQPTVEVTWAPVGDTTLSATLIASVSYPGVSEPVVNTKEVWGWSKSYPALPPSFDFGTTEVGSTAVLGVTLANLGSDIMTVELPAEGDFDLQPNDETLGQVDVFGISHPSHITVAAGQSRTVSFLWTPSSVGSIDSLMSFRSSYADVQRSGVFLPIHEQIPVSGTALASPAELVLRDPVSQQVLSGLDFGRLTLGTNPAPAIEVELANVGGVPLPPLSEISIDGFFNIVGGNGANCSLVRGNYFCFEPLIPDPTYLLAEELAGLGAGQQVNARVRFYPKSAEAAYSEQLSISYGGETLAFPIVAEVVPYLLNDPLALARTGSGAVSKQAPAGAGTFVVDVMEPRLARGLRADRVFAGIGDLDSVNLLNGNLFMKIPIGINYPVGGDLAYRLQLNYNSNVWDRWRQAGEFVALAPQAGANAGVGWMLHLGRLLEPVDLDALRGMSQEERDRSLSRTTDFRYLDPSGSMHVFDTHLHVDGESVASSADLEAVEFLYSQDASYLRMKRLDAAQREIEFPDGTIHLFVRKTLAQWNDSWPDLWRLKQIRDRNGNQIDLFYEARTDGPGVQWRLSDGHRQQLIKLKPDASGYYPYVIDRVELAGFGGSRSTFVFGYVTRTVDRLFVGATPGQTPTVRVPLLSSLTLPDGSGYRFSYYLTGGGAAGSGQDTLRISGADLPTGGRIEWAYRTYVQPATAACLANVSDPAIPDEVRLVGVRSRTVKDEAGRQLDLKLFSQGLADGTTVPSSYCDNWNDPPSPFDGLPAEPPAAQSRTQVVSPLEYDEDGNAIRNNVTLSYFSVFPFPVNPESLNRPGSPRFLAGGWNGHEFGLPFTRNVLYDADADEGEEEYLSSRVYECGSSLNLGNCTLLRSTYLRYERSPKFHNPEEPTTPANARLITTRQVFEDDGDNWIRTHNTDFDGLGHFRTADTTASFGKSRRRTVFQNYNPAFTLVADGEGIDSNINPPEVWILDTFNRQWVRGTERVNGNDRLLQRRGGQRCWTLEDARKTLDWERTWAGGNPGDGDLVLRYTYEQGNRETEELFVTGFEETPGGCEVDLPSPQYTVEHSYAHGSLQTTGFAGASYLTIDRTIDANTGLTAAERDTGRVETTLDYDAMGRLSTSRHATFATRTYDYEVPCLVQPPPPGSELPCGTVATPRVAVREHPLDDPDTTLTEATILYDALGRVSGEIELQPDGTDSQRQFTYTPRGTAATVTTQQAVAAFDPDEVTAYTWDALGRILAVGSPDGSTQEMAYTGARLAVLTRSVGTTFVAGNPGSVTQTDTTLSRHLDAFGRLEELETPAYTTRIEYDSLDQASAVSRGAQTRTAVTDGRGFLTSETSPEKTDPVTYGGYDALGNVGTKTDGPNTLVYGYDMAGRLLTVRSAGKLLKSFTYYGAGGASNGRLHTALRNHHLTAANTPGFPGVAGIWSVQEIYEYHGHGRVRRRETHVEDYDRQPIANFDQVWHYSDRGEVVTDRYPRACDEDFGVCYSNGRTVTYGYSAGKLTSVTAGGNLGGAVAYHPNGMIATVTHDGGLIDDYGLDPDNLQRVGFIDLAGPSPALGAHRYDGSGNLIQIGNRRYTYDAVSRLTAHYRLGVLQDSFGYDIFDNLVLIDGESQGIDPDSNRVDGQDYDGDGNQTSDACVDYVYDPLSLLRTHHQDPGPAGCNGSATWISLYTADDRRILVGGTASGFHWTVRDLNGMVLSTFSGAGPGIARLKDYTYRDGLLLASRGGGVTEHLHLDHLGSPRALSTNGEVDNRSFAPYGAVLGDDGGEAFGFTGHEHDPDGENIYMLARTYSSGRGRFLQVDQGRSGDVVALQQWSKYTYGKNNPLRFDDPNGRDAREALQLLGAIGDRVNPRGFLGATLAALVAVNDSRNGRNAPPPTLEEAERSVRKGVGTELPPGKSVFHKQGLAALKARKFVFPDGSEGVYMPDGTLDESPLNGGTFNFGLTDGEHVLFDVIPYYILGTGPDDPSSFIGRLLTTLRAIPAIDEAYQQLLLSGECAEDYDVCVENWLRRVLSEPPYNQ